MSRITALESQLEALRADGIVSQNEETAVLKALDETLPTDPGGIDRGLSFFVNHPNYLFALSVLTKISQRLDDWTGKNPDRAVWRHTLAILLAQSSLQDLMARTLTALARDRDGLTAAEFYQIYKIGRPDLSLGPLREMDFALVCGAINLYLWTAIADRLKSESTVIDHFEKLARPGKLEGGVLKALLDQYRTTAPTEIGTTSPPLPETPPAEPPRKKPRPRKEPSKPPSPATPQPSSQPPQKPEEKPANPRRRF